MVRKFSSEEVIARAIEVHGKGRYDYTLIEDYTVINRTYEIICCICDKIFEQNFNNHVNYKSGCPYCVGKGNKLNDIIQKSIKVHGNKYSYHLVKNYKNMNTKYKIFCNTCQNIFAQCFNVHITMKCGCPYCANQKYTLDHVISLARKVHKENYDYSLIEEYKRMKDKYDIICNKCGKIFSQNLNDHINDSCGCPYCANKKYTLSDVIQKAKNVHGNVCSYDLIKEYKGMNAKYKIICNLCHTIFEKVFKDHVNGLQGCPECSKKRVKENGAWNKIELSDIKKRAKLLHKDKYSYELITEDIYKNVDHKYNIICKKCNGIFMRSLYKHLNLGRGCPYCKPKGYSKISIKAFNIIEKVKNIKIKHAESGGETRIDLKDYSGKLKYYKSHLMIDGITENGTCVEFNGCEYHGCVFCTSHSAISTATGKPYKELYEKTLEKKRILLDLGYAYTEIWECKFIEALGDNEDPETNPDLKNLILGLKKLTKKKKVEEVPKENSNST